MQRKQSNNLLSMRPYYKPIYHPREQGWIQWIMANRFVMIIILIVFLIVIGPWLFCDVLGFQSICSILSGIFSLIAKIFHLVGL
jgi:hypothetical protein